VVVKVAAIIPLPKPIKPIVIPANAIRVNGCTIWPSGKVRKQAGIGPEAPRCYWHTECLRGIWSDVYGYPACRDAVIAKWPFADGFDAQGTPDLPTEKQKQLKIEYQMNAVDRPSVQSMCLDA
jgi:hypothetical protein